MKSVLVTGGNGQLGSELKASAPRHQDFDFTFIDLDDVDLTDEKAIRIFLETRNFDYLINCAAYTAVDKAEEEEANARLINAVAVKIMAEICRKRGIKMIHVSTDYVFDGESNVPIPEQAPPKPISAYGRTKLEGERYMQAILQEGIIVRTAWVYSTFGKNFVKSIVQLARQRPEIGVVADQIGSPTYARDLATAIMRIVSCAAEGPVEGGLFHYTNEGVTSWYDFACFIVDYYGLKCKVKPIRTFEYKTLAARPKFSLLDKTKFKTTFKMEIPNWTASLKECLGKMPLS